MNRCKETQRRGTRRLEPLFKQNFKILLLLSHKKIFFCFLFVFWRALFSQIKQRARARFFLFFEMKKYWNFAASLGAIRAH